MAELPSFRTAAERARDTTRLGATHPYLAGKVLRVLDAMEMLGYPMFVTEGLRSDAQQIADYAQGRTAPGGIVTNADGITHKSLHQKQADGFSHAVDCAFIDDPLSVKIETWDINQPWELYGRMAEQFGLTWGGRWQTIKDRPHVELPLLSPHAILTAPTP